MYHTAESDKPDRAAGSLALAVIPAGLPAPRSAPTVLPGPMAKAVSLATRSTSLAIRLGSFLGACGVDAAKFTTLSSLELGRGVLEAILSRAGKDVASRAGSSDLGRAEAESILERSLEGLHHAVSQAVFWTATGFHLTSAALAAASDTTQLILSSLDQLLGSTDSSRAIASIITLIRREFRNPATGVPGERVGVIDLVLGLSAFAYLQGRSRRLLDEESRQVGVDEVVWDVVVLEDGERIDVHDDTSRGVSRGAYNNRGTDVQSIVVGEGSNELVKSVERCQVSSSEEDDDDLPEIRLKRQIIQSLPSDGTAFMSTTTTTTKTITVDVNSGEQLFLAPPPGVQVVEQRQLLSRPYSEVHGANGPVTNTYRVVYKIDRHQEHGSFFQGHGYGDGSQAVTVLDNEGETERDIYTVADDLVESAPKVPERSSVTKSCSSQPLLPDSVSRIPIPDRSSSRITKTEAQNLSSDGRSSLPVPNRTANQKKQRAPLPQPQKQRVDPSRPSQSTSTNKQLPKLPAAKSPAEQPSSRTNERKSGIRNALKLGPAATLNRVWNKDTAPGDSRTADKKKFHEKPTSKMAKSSATDHVEYLSPNRVSPRTPTARGNRDGADYEATDPYLRPSSRASFVSVLERQRDTMVSQTDTYSIHSIDSCGRLSPTMYRAESRAQGSMAKSRSEKDIADSKKASPVKFHRRSRSQINSASLYSIASSNSQTSLVLASARHHKSVYSNDAALPNLRQTGMAEGAFPERHLLHNITRYMLFSSAAYGANFLRCLGIAKEMPVPTLLDDRHHREIRAFAHHTALSPESVLLASFVDPQGQQTQTSAVGGGSTALPLVHYVSLDHAARAVVLACRGTLGFEDVLADMTCDYDDLIWRGRVYKVHKGIHDSARRLLYGGDGRVLATLKAALEEFPEYGLVLCGHSLGGAVTALLGVMLADASPNRFGFVTTLRAHQRLLTDGNMPMINGSPLSDVCLPSGRPIHVYAYGPPGTMDPALRRATRGLITTVVHGSDLVPFLSLGTLHDFQAAALAFKRGPASRANDDDDAAADDDDDHERDEEEALHVAEVRQRVWQALQSTMADKWRNTSRRPSDEEHERWAFDALRILRRGMTATKLLPPGEVFMIESTRVLRRDAFLLAGVDDFGRPAKRIVLRYVRDVEARFREVRFGTSMLLDHSPGRYEEALDTLRLGVIES